MLNIAIIVLIFIVPAMTIYLLTLKGKKSHEAKGYGILAGILGMGVCLFLYKLTYDRHLYDAIYEFYNSEYVVDSMKQALDMLGVAKHQQDKVMIQMVKNTLTTMPANFTIFLMIYSYIVGGISGRILRNKKKRIYAQPPFRAFTIPRQVFVGFLVMVVLTFVTQFIFPDLKNAGIIDNLVIIFEFLLVVQGMSFITFYLLLKNVKKPFVVIILAALLIFPLSRSAFSILGLIEVLFGLRLRISQNSINKKDKM